MFRLKNILLVALVCVIGGSAFIVYKKFIHKPEIDPLRYAQTVKELTADQRNGLTPEGAIVVVGSSSIGQWHGEMTEDLAPLTVLPRGFGGSTMKDLAHFLKPLVLDAKPRAVVIYEGDNDTSIYKRSAKEITPYLDEVLGKISSELPDARIYLLAVKPSPTRWGSWGEVGELNRYYRSLAETQDHITFIDTASGFLNVQQAPEASLFKGDGVHLNQQGRRIWAKAIGSVLIPAEQEYEIGAESKSETTAGQ